MTRFCFALAGDAFVMDHFDWRSLAIQLRSTWDTERKFPLIMAHRSLGRAPQIGHSNSSEKSNSAMPVFYRSSAQRGWSILNTASKQSDIRTLPQIRPCFPPPATGFPLRVPQGLSSAKDLDCGTRETTRSNPKALIQTSGRTPMRSKTAATLLVPSAMQELCL